MRQTHIITHAGIHKITHIKTKYLDATNLYRERIIKDFLNKTVS